jgi:hypothetical protein
MSANLTHDGGFLRGDFADLHHARIASARPQLRHEKIAQVII